MHGRNSRRSLRLRFVAVKIRWINYRRLLAKTKTSLRIQWGIDIIDGIDI